MKSTGAPPARSFAAARGDVYRSAHGQCVDSICTVCGALYGEYILYMHIYGLCVDYIWTQYRVRGALGLVNGLYVNYESLGT